MMNKRAREMGLGKYPDVTLADARERASEARKLRAQGRDPIDERLSEKLRRATEAAKAVTFEAAAHSYIESNRQGWKNAKHAAQWRATIETYVLPTMGKVSVQEIDVAMVLKAIEPIWMSKPETASRVRGRIEAILDWAKARGFRVGENPARWRGHLDKILPQRSKIMRVKHHSALPFSELQTFMQNLRSHDGTSALAFEFAILTAARTGEVLGARWSEINLAGGVWTVPAERMKAGREHRAPLSTRSIAILQQLNREQSPSEFVFPGKTEHQPLSNMSLLMLLRRMKRKDITAHGFRSTFRDWVAEHTTYPNEVAELALAHAISDKVEAAYRRGDMFEKRRAMMEDWSIVCG
jgi:integrase